MAPAGHPCERDAAERAERAISQSAPDPALRSARRSHLDLDGPGAQLRPGERAHFEERLGGDLSAVRVHRGPDTDALAALLAARAFALGSHIGLRRREGTGGAEGERVLAHELAHTLQPEGPTRIVYRTVEESEASGAVPVALLRSSGFAAKAGAFEAALRTVGSLADARQEVERHGRQLWVDATARANLPQGADTDDRPLYWARLKMSAALRSWTPSFGLSAATRNALIESLEAHSRGRESVSFAGVPEGHKKILISGFDPFGFQGPGGDLRQGNPSGAAALALDGETIQHGREVARIQSVIFPVRYGDFDTGVVESTFQRFLSGPDRVDMIMTISQGGQRVGAGSRTGGTLSAFELERWAGRRRSVPSFPDNLGRTQGSPQNPIEAPNLGPGDEFIQSTLPRTGILGDLGRSETRFEREFTEIPRGSTSQVGRTSGQPSARSTAVEGSGGGFLSNEIFYRTVRLAGKRSPVRVGHLHVPLLTPPTGTGQSEARHTRDRDETIAGVRRILRLSLRHI